MGKLILIDSETGDIIQEIPENMTFCLMEAGDRIIRKSSIEGFNKKKDINIVENRRKDKDMVNNPVTAFSIINHSGYASINNKLSGSEKIFLLSLSTYIGYEDGVLKNGNGIPLKLNDFCKITGLSKRTISTVIKELKSKNIICTQGAGKGMIYIINPYIISKGKKIRRSLLELFDNYER